jgi:hypothetical protein
LSADTALTKDVGRLNLNGANIYKIKPASITSTKLDSHVSKQKGKLPSGTREASSSASRYINAAKKKLDEQSSILDEIL